jgi:hypothetical protein
MNIANRRVFLTQAAALSCGTLWNDSTVARTFVPALAARVTESQVSGKSNGHFFFLPVTGDFTFESRVVGNTRRSTIKQDRWSASTPAIG